MMLDWGINVTWPTFSPTVFQSEGYWMLNRDTGSLYVQNASIAYARVITNIIIIIAAIKKAEETKEASVIVIIFSFMLSRIQGV
ncbi:MAG TPA: hypothetical protein VE593_06645 [Nitrososphaeraceae archaeon]|nr:hypothetical protein [Nitrososphaeraceae archaeon]